MPFMDAASLVVLAFRRLRRSPGFALAAILLLGVGVGLGVPLFNIINVQLLKPAAAGRDFVRVVINHSGGLAMAQGEVDAVWLNPPESFSVLLGSGLRNTTAVVDGVSLRVTVEGIAGPYFAEFPTVPLAGRLLTLDDQREGREVALIGERLSRAAFAGAAEAIGAPIVLGGRRVTVIGVIPDGYDPAPTWRAIQRRDAWLPATITPPTELFGRLRAGTSLDQADAELASRRLPPHEDGSPRVLGVRQGIGPELGDLSERMYAQLVVMFVAGIAVSLVAAGSFSILLFARLLSRQADLSIRLALGATSRDLTHLLAVEAGILAIGASVVAVWIGTLLSSLFVAQLVSASGIAFAPDLTPDWRLVVYTTLTTFGAAMLVVGKLAWNIRSLEALGSLVATSGVGSSTQRTAGVTNRLVITQTAVSTGLLLVAVMLGRTILADADSHGLDVDRSAVAWLDGTALPKTAPEAETIVRRALRATREAPGVIDAAIITMLPGGGGLSTGVSPGQPGLADMNRRAVRSHYTSANGPAMLGRSLRAGRMFTEDEAIQGARVAVVSAVAAARLWPESDALGRRLRFTRHDSDGPLFIVVGIVDDEATAPGARRELGDIYVPFAHRPASSPVGIILRGSGDSVQLAERARESYRTQLPDTGFLHVRSMREEFAERLGAATFWGRMYGLLGVLVLIVAMGGLYGLSAHLAALRRREIGIRRALGATTTTLCRMLHHEHSRMLAMGVGSGCLAGLFFASLILRYFPTLSLWDPIALGVVASTLYVAGLAGALAPFMRTMRAASIALKDV